MARNPLTFELEQLPTRLEALLAGVSDDDLRRRPGADGWSAKEIAGHLRDAARIYHERLFLASTHDRPFLAPYDEAALARDRNYQEMDPATILPELRGWRDETVDLLGGQSDDVWNRVAVHGEIGEMTVLHLAVHMVEHESMHLRDLARLLNREVQW